MGKDQEKDDSLNLITPIGVACFVHVWEPHAFADESGNKKDPNYGLILVFDKGEALKEMKKACGRALIKKFGEAKAKAMAKTAKLPFRMASEYAEYGAPFDAEDAEERIMVSFKSRSAPGVVNARAKAIMNQPDFYAGCLARVSCYAHAFDSMGNKGVTFLLNNVQKMGEGEKLAGSRRSAEDDFGADSEAGGDEDLDDIFGS